MAPLLDETMSPYADDLNALSPYLLSNWLPLLQMDIWLITSVYDLTTTFWSLMPENANTWSSPEESNPPFM